MLEDPRPTIDQSAARLMRRWIGIEWLRTSLRAWFWSLLIAAIVIWFTRPFTLASGALALALATALPFALGLVLAYRNRPTTVALAKAYDDAAGLDDRLSSALENAGNGPFAALLREEAATAAAGVDPRRLITVRIPREGRWLPIPALFCAIALILPSWLDATAEVDVAFEEAVKEHLGNLDEFIAKEKAKDPTGKKKELLAKLEKLSLELDRKKSDKNDLLAEVSKMAEDLEKEREQKELERKELEKALKTPKAGDFSKDVDQSLQRGDYQEALNKLDQLEDELEKKIKELKEQGKLEEAKALEEQLAKVKELKAKLMKLLQLNLDLDALSDVLDFVDAFEGDLGDLEKMLKKVKLVKHECKDPKL